MNTEGNKYWHSKDVEDVLKLLDTKATGLSDKEASLRLNKYGENKIKQDSDVFAVKIILDQFKSPLIYILIIASIVSWLLGERIDSYIIIVAVVLNSSIGFLQDYKASRALEELKKYLKLKTSVLRNGSVVQVEHSMVVPGDIILVKAGDKVPADARIIEQSELLVNEAVLTGESIADTKINKIIAEDIELADRENMLYMGTTIESGKGKCIVVATGGNTELGRIAIMIRETKDDKTPYQEKIEKFSKTIGIIVLTISLLIFIVGYLNGLDFAEILITSIAVAVAAIPEGLPVAITVIFAIGMSQILKKKGLVRKLASAETLGSTNIICTDKTGTLTKADMSISKIVSYKESVDIQKDGKINGDILKILEIGCIRSNTDIEKFDPGLKKKSLNGYPTDKAISYLAYKNGILKKDLLKKYSPIDEVEFSSKIKYSASLHKYNKKDNIYFVMGASEEILDGCGKYLKDKNEIRLTGNNNLHEIHDKMTISGLRVLAVAYKKTFSKSIGKIKNEDLVFVGFLGLEDPVRKDAKNSIQSAIKAGVRPIIITGDNKLTAISVAKNIGLKINNENVLEGREITKLSNKQLFDEIENIDIFARVEPQQKLRIVNAWQEKGKVVAMTGDGVNDAPALKKADIAVVVGSGTNVAKEVADIVLLKDDFSVIVSAIEQGRVIIDNIRKVVTYSLTGAFTEIILIAGAILAGFPLPFTAAQILWINLVEDGLPNIALAFEPKESGLMNKKPEPKNIPLLNNEMKILIYVVGIVTDVFLFGIFYWLLNFTNYTLTHIQSLMFVALAIDSLMFVFSIKSLRKNIWQINVFSNKYLIYAVITSFLLLLLAIYLPALNNILGTQPLNSIDLLILLGFALVKITLIELVKAYYIKKKEIW